MASAARTVRSRATPGKGHPQSQPISTRPELNLVKGTQTGGRAMVEGARRVISWTHTRGTPMMHILVAVIFLATSMFGSLMLRTQMVQNSFEAPRVQNSISNLTQDVQDDQNKLDQLQASLPDKAQELGMQPQQGLNSIDLQGYQAPSSDKTGGQH